MNIDSLGHINYMEILLKKLKYSLWTNLIKGLKAILQAEDSLSMLLYKNV